jgi:hypothetical protein
MRGRAGPLPLPPGGMFCEFTRPYPTLTLAMVVAAGSRSPAQPHVPYGISQTFCPLPTEFRSPRSSA